MDKFIEKLDKVTLFIAGIAFAAMIAITSINVFARYTVSKSFAWAEELTYLCFNWAVFFGICNVYKNQGLISIDTLVRKLPEKIQQKFRIVTFAIVFVMDIALSVWGWQLTIGGWQRKTANLYIPYTFVDICLPISMMIMGFYSAVFIYKEIKGNAVKQQSLDKRA